MVRSTGRIRHSITKERIDAMNNQPPPVNGAREALRGAADALLAASADIAIAALWDVGTHLIAELGSGTTTSAQATARTVAGARAADRAVRKHPYLAIGMGLCVGVVLACFLIPRRRGAAA
jgi:ElaB/YqjD/DUF883 family membrane-anchored ribosome-binding protein